METSLYSHKDVTAFRGCKLEPVKFSLRRKCILDEFLTLVADSPPSLAVFFCRSGTFLTEMRQFNQELIYRCAMSFESHRTMVLSGLARYQPQMGRNHRVPVWDLSLVLRLVVFGLNIIQNGCIVMCLFLSFCFRTLTVGKPRSVWLLPGLRQ